MLTNEDYVDLATARLLKQKGYDEPTQRWYSFSKRGVIKYKSSDSINANSLAFGVSAPTLYEAQKWLREQHGYHVAVQPTISMESWYWCVTGHKSTHREDDNRNPQTYTEALLAGIKEALTLLPDKQ